MRATEATAGSTVHGLHKAAVRGPFRPESRRDRDDLDAEAVARRALEIAADICVFTNRNILIESL